MSLLVRLLFPRALLITPNLDEAAMLVGRPLASEADMLGAAQELLGMGARAVLLKGGHLAGDTVADLLLRDIYGPQKLMREGVLPPHLVTGHPQFLRPLPKPALLPPLILFLGIGDAMKLTIIGLGVFFPVLINTVQGVRGTDPVMIDVARTFGHRPRNQLFKVILPSALPMILSGMRVSLGLGLILVVIAEMLAGTGGVGYLILDMQRSFKVPQMYAWIVILAVLGYALNAAFVFAERRVIHWSFVDAR